MGEEGSDPVDPARDVWEVPGDGGQALLLLEELPHPLHLRLEGVDHPLVLGLHVVNVEDPGQLLEPGEVLEGVGSVPDVAVAGLQLCPEHVLQELHLPVEVQEVHIEFVISEVKKVVLSHLENCDNLGKKKKCRK